MTPLLNAFIQEEVTPHIRELMAAAVAAHQADPAIEKRRFELNRFEVTFDFVKGSVLIEDVTNTGDNGETRLSLDEFFSFVT